MEYKGKNNLIGRRFGRLIVIEYLGESYWRCQCDCGKITKVKTSALNSGKTKSCGCLRGENLKGNTRKSHPKIDLTGQRFGSLIVKEYIKGGLWKCLCDCGKETIVDTRNLNNGHTRSCGCLVKKINSENNTKDMTGYENDGIIVLNRNGSTKEGIALWRCKCKICGREFTTSGAHIREDAIRSCGCIHSLNEQKISKMLIDNNIEFSSQYTFPDLKGPNNGALRFDFAIFKNHQLSHLIEYNGKQHYEKPTGNWGKNFEVLQKSDKIKIDYCNKHNIPLIIIKYDENYDINTLLNKPVETIPGQTGSTVPIDTEREMVFSS